MALRASSALGSKRVPSQNSPATSRQGTTVVPGLASSQVRCPITNPTCCTLLGPGMAGKRNQVHGSCDAYSGSHVDENLRE